jgi:hypothetical protein
MLKFIDAPYSGRTVGKTGNTHFDEAVDYKSSNKSCFAVFFYGFYENARLK